MGYIMQPPDELMSQVFLPSMRQLVALRLRSEGLSQNKIADLLGTTQASVSMYLKSDRERAYMSLSRLSVPKPEADRYAVQLASAATQSAVEGVRSLNTIWTDLLGRGSVCPAHREMYHSLSNCDVCIQFYGKRNEARSRAISEVADAVRILEGSQKFVTVMPEVSVNVACVVGDATSPADVVAIPGRIVRVRDRARAMLPPEAGASAHMARVLLLVRTRHPEFRACMNLRYDLKMAKELRRGGLKTLAMGRYTRLSSEDPTVDALARRLRSSTEEFDAVVDEGGSGIEPNVYLFSKGARELAELAIRLAKAYSAG